MYNTVVGNIINKTVIDIHKKIFIDTIPECYL